MQSDTIINSEDEALEYLNKTKDPNSSYGSVVHWDKWHLKITGKDYSGTVDINLLRLLLELQNSIFKFYAYLNYNSSDTRKLTQEEKNRLKLNISVKEGSTDIGIELSDIINKIILNMSPDHTFFVVLTAVVLFFGSKGFKQWLDDKKDRRESDLEAKNQSLWHSTYEKFSDILEKLSKDELAKTQVIADMAQEMHENSLRCLKGSSASSIEYQNQNLDMDKIKDILRTDKVIREPKSLRLDGVYQVLTINYEKENYIEFKLCVVRVENLKRGDTITAFYHKNAVVNDVLFRVIENRSFYIEINGKMLDDILEEATIVNIKEHQESKTSNE